MSLPPSMILIEGLPGLSLIIWFIIFSIGLYMMRTASHQAISAGSRMLYRIFRLTSRSIIQTKDRVKVRNKEVLIANAKEANEHMIEREFDRIENAVKKDLASYPALQHKISETITTIDEEYQKSAEIPPAPPGWVAAIEPIASIKSEGDPMVGNILTSIQNGLVKGQDKALAQYRQSSKKRHDILKRIAPKWRVVQKGLSEVDSRVKSILDRSKSIDRHMEDYENLVRAKDKGQHALSSSSLTQFFIAGFVLIIAIGGAMINFNLIARPMQEMVGGSNYMMGFKVSDIAALVIILVEISMGLFLMESLRITRLFPVIGALNDKIRFRMVIVSFVFLLLLASIEAGLAYMRELLSQDDAALMSSLTSSVTARVESSAAWITTASQMGMGFVLPFALTFIAIPLESFIHSFRTVFGVVVVAFLHFLAFLSRFTGSFILGFGKLLINLYDLVIFLPLWVESLIQGKKLSHIMPVLAKDKKEK
ncbi:MAG: hypothetical protein OEW60_03880 [Thiovulaceae bacterium]|nr:hypothetical protein [Sulfurimonadaceae bacterium]